LQKKRRIFSVKTSLYVATTKLQRLNATKKKESSYKILLRVTCDFLVSKSPSALQSHQCYTGNRTGSRNNELRYFVISYFIALAKRTTVLTFIKPITLQLQRFTGPPSGTLCLYK
jgi:hypothetical protein